MSEDHADLTTHLHALLAQKYGETSAGFELSGPIHRGLYGEVYRVRLPANGVELAVKICLSPKLGGTHGYFAERQFKEMRIFFGALANSRQFRVPRPVAVAAKYGILVMEWAEGESLSEIARFGGPDKLVNGMAMAGAWLRHFHRACPRAKPQPLRSKLIEEVAIVREKLMDSRVTMPEARRSLSMLSEAVDQISQAGLEQSWLHSDFQPSNIIIGRRSVYGIDMAFAAYGYALADAAHFLNGFEWSTLTKSGWRNFRHRRLCEEAFISGYFADEKPGARFALWWFRIFDNLKFLLRYHSEPQSWTQYAFDQR